MVKRPTGLPEIIKTFGNIPFMAIDGILTPAEEATFVTTIQLPFPIQLSWMPMHTTKMRCHKALADTFIGVFKTIEARGFAHLIKTFGGCYNFRVKRSSSKLSTHAWGIATDLNIDTNQMGTKGDMNPEIVAIFRDFGFIWGGDFGDPMHFQYCGGY